MLKFCRAKGIIPNKCHSFISDLCHSESVLKYFSIPPKLCIFWAKCVIHLNLIYLPYYWLPSDSRCFFRLLIQLKVQPLLKPLQHFSQFVHIQLISQIKHEQALIDYLISWNQIQMLMHQILLYLRLQRLRFQLNLKV